MKWPCEVVDVIFQFGNTCFVRSLKTTPKNVGKFGLENGLLYTGVVQPRVCVPLHLRMQFISTVGKNGCFAPSNDHVHDGMGLCVRPFVCRHRYRLLQELRMKSSEMNFTRTGAFAVDSRPCTQEAMHLCVLTNQTPDARVIQFVGLGGGGAAGRNAATKSSVTFAA